MIDISTGNYRKNTCEKNEIHIEGKYHDWIEKRNNNIISSVLFKFYWLSILTNQHEDKVPIATECQKKMFYSNCSR